MIHMITIIVMSFFIIFCNLRLAMAEMQPPVKKGDIDYSSLYVLIFIGLTICFICICVFYIKKGNKSDNGNNINPSINQNKEDVQGQLLNINVNEELDKIINNFFSDELHILCDKAKDLDNGDKLFILEKAIDNALADNFLSEPEERRIFLYGMRMDINNILPYEIKLKINKAGLLRDIFQGTVCPRMSLLDCPFKLMKNEIFIWNFPNIHISEIKTVKGWVGGSSGLSFRVMKGVYWRVGATKGKRVEHNELVTLGTGDVTITSKHVYMHANHLEAMRIRLNKIISVGADADNVIIFREGARANPICFTTGESQFMANLIQNADNWQ